MTREEAVHRNLALGRSKLAGAVLTICLYRGATPWDPEKDPGQECGACLLQAAPRVIDSEQSHLRGHPSSSRRCRSSAGFLPCVERVRSRREPALDHVWKMDETGEREKGSQPSESDLDVSNCGALEISLCALEISLLSTLAGDASRIEG